VTELELNVEFDPPAEDVDAVERGLHAFNLAQLGEDVIYDYHRLAVIARDEHGEIVGGIHGELCWEWLHIDAMWVAEQQRGRGIGARLLAAIEEAALSKGFSKAHLETTDFQALGFYVKHGYEVFGRLEGKPAGHSWYYVKKDLSGPPPTRAHPTRGGAPVGAGASVAPGGR
jgi:GNAT superfamily N-acetyltransferase